MSEQEQSLVEQLRIRAEIRLQAKGRKSVEEGKHDRLADLLLEAANKLEYLEREWKKSDDRVMKFLNG